MRGSSRCCGSSTVCGSRFVPLQALAPLPVFSDLSWLPQFLGKAAFFLLCFPILYIIKGSFYFILPFLFF